MAKYKVGDKVRVKDHPVDVGPGWTIDMDKMLGKIVTISRVMPSGWYRIEESYYTWCDEMFEGLTQTTGNEVIDLLMKKLGVEVDEEFGLKKSSFNPYHFNKDGKLLDNMFDERPGVLLDLIYGEKEIKKIPKIKEMTVAELEEALKLPKGTLRVKGDD